MASNGEELTEEEQLIAEQVGEWSTSSNEALTVSLYQGDNRIESFNPKFTYPIYGEEEVIFGYQGLEIQLAFAAHNLTPHLSTKHKKKFPTQGEIKATDLREPLKEFLPAVAFQESTRSTALADHDAPKFVPPGEKLQTFDTDTGMYEVWVSPLAEPRTKAILQNMQILVPMFIEGGTILELDYQWIVDRWKVFFLYRIADNAPSGTSKYVFAGYATAFQVFTLPDRGEALEKEIGHISDAEMDKVVNGWANHELTTPSPLSLPSRERISQFIILPSHQGAGLGSRLYSTIYSHLTAPSHITELTVEDPNEDFDDMRDICDLIHLRSTNTSFTSLTIPNTLPSATLNPASPVPTTSVISESVRAQLIKETKIQPRQLSRLIEMQLLSTIPHLHRSRNRITRKEKSSNEHDRQYYFWRLYVKERLYQHNRDTLIQLEPEERVEKVDDAVEGLQLDYERLIGRADDRMARMKANGIGNGKVGAGKKKGRKRVAVDEEDGGDEAVEEDEEGAKKERRKRKRIVDDEDEDGIDVGEEV